MTDKRKYQPAEPASVSLQSRTHPTRRILVVEDDSDIRQLGTELLTRSGYEVDCAADGAAAWEALNTDTCYDLMIIDNNMPKLTGVGLLKKLRAARMALPVIMATGILPEHEFTRYPWLQPAATLLKPYTADELLGTVRNILHGIDNAQRQIAPLANWQDKPLSNRLSL
jgi:two-component system response regulator QseB